MGTRKAGGHLNKAFTKEDDGEATPAFRSRFQPVPAGFRNLISAAGAARLRQELADLVAHLAAGTAPFAAGDQRPDQQVQRLKWDIDDLAKRLETQEIAPRAEAAPTRVGFGATVRVRDGSGAERTYTLVGVDETDPAAGRISWTSPIARALLHQGPGASVQVASPNGPVDLEILALSP